MTDDLAVLQNRLARGYQEQLPLYDRAIACAGAQESDCRAEELNAILREIAALDAALTEDKALWRSARRPAGPHLQAALDGVTARIATLAAAVDRRIADIQTRKQAMTPRIDACIQERRMLHAYGKSR